MDSKTKIPIFLLVALLAGLTLVFVERNARERDHWEARAESLRQLKEAQIRLSAQIQDLAGSGECEESHECRILGYGLRACEGYNEFLIYSVKDANQEELLRKVNEYNKNAVQLNDLDFAVPHCGVATPRVACIEELCQKVVPQ